MTANLIVNSRGLDLSLLRRLQERPEPFAPGNARFWDDPYISAQMLAAHLDPHTDAASRRPGTIDDTIAWLVPTLELHPGAAVLDLGCGPGLYTHRLAARGIAVTGIDLSRRSIDYAINDAAERRLAIEYRCENYLCLADRERYDAALLIYGDYCVLAEAERARLLHNVYRALRPGGRFVLDVTTREHRKGAGWHGDYSVEENGFWKPGLCLVLRSGFDYPEQSIFLNQAIVVESDGVLSLYRLWFQDFSPETIASELQAVDFSVESMWSDLQGSRYHAGSEWIGLVARRPNR